MKRGQVGKALSFVLKKELVCLCPHLYARFARQLTNENVSYFLTNQSKTKTFIDLKVTRKPKPSKNSTRPYLNENPAHFIHEIKTKGYDVIGVNAFLRKLMIPAPKSGVNGPSYTTKFLLRKPSVRFALAVI